MESILVHVVPEARQNDGELLAKNFLRPADARLPLINARRAVGERERGGVDNWNYVKKALVRKDDRARRRLKKRTRCRHVTDVIDDRDEEEEKGGRKEGRPSEYQRN